MLRSSYLEIGGQKLALFIPEVFQTIIWRFTTFLRIYPHLFRFHWSIVPQYGTMTQLGHVDFFPGSSLLSDWGWNQPGCWQFEDVGSCSHSRAHDLFISSVSRPCHVLQTCANSTEIPDTCSNITQATAPVMGWWAGPGAGQVFTVNTTAAAPFCAEMRPPTRRKLLAPTKKKRRIKMRTN